MVCPTCDLPQPSPGQRQTSQVLLLSDFVHETARMLKHNPALNSMSRSVRLDPFAPVGIVQVNILLAASAFFPGISEKLGGLK